MKKIAFLIGSLALGIATLTATTTTAHAATPATLDGEILLDFAAADLRRVACTPDGSTTFSYHEEGTASGPYPGTFTQDSTVTIGPTTMPYSGSAKPDYGNILTYQATFEIRSGDTTIRGSKTLTTRYGHSIGFCIDEPTYVSPFFYYEYVEVLAYVDYSAVIVGPFGTYRTSGVGSDSGAYNEYTRDDEPQPGPYHYGSIWVGRFDRSDGIEPAGPGPANTVVLDPATSVGTVGGTHTLTATLSDTSGQPVDPTRVLFQVAGSTTTSGTCTTSAGSCSWSYTGPALPGADAITACADNDADQTCDADEPSAEATIAWLLPASTPGQVTGGGQVDQGVAFGFTAQDRNGTTRGSCTVVDQSPASGTTQVKCLDVSRVVIDGTHATVFGRATVNGTESTYRIDVDDLGEPGRGSDTFRIRTGSGYTAGGTLTGGNIQIHR